MSSCARELIELGLKIEEAASKLDQLNDGVDADSFVIEALKKNMAWTLEVRFLLRFLLEKGSNFDSDIIKNFLEKAKERASAHVAELFNEQNSHAFIAQKT